MPTKMINAVLNSDLETVKRLAQDPELRETQTVLTDDYGQFWESMTPLMVAACAPGEKAVFVRALLEAGADPLAKPPDGGVGAAFYAAGAGNHWVIDDSEGESLAGDALKGDYAERLRILLDAGANPHEIAGNGRNLMAEAAGTGDPERVRILLDAEVSPVAPAIVPERRVIPGEERRPLKNPLGHSPCNIPLFRAAESGSADCVRLLLEAGALLTERDQDGHTALVDVENPEVMRLLIDKGLAPDDLDLWQRICWNDRAQIASVLLEKGGSPNLILKYFSLAHEAALWGSFDTLRLLVHYGADLGWRTQRGDSALHNAVFFPRLEVHGHEEIVRYLVDQGLDVNEKDRIGWTPLHIAAWGDGGAPDAIRVLLELGADPDPADKHERTPLMLCLQFGGADEECVALLLAAGADPDRIGHEGHTAKDLAVQNRDIWIRLSAENTDPEKIESYRRYVEAAERTLSLFTP